MTENRRGWNLKGPDKPVMCGEEHYAWKGDGASEPTKRDRARRLYESGPCRECGKPGERHHLDGDPGNNEPANIALLCRYHHMALDGRLERLRVAGEPFRRAPRPLVICSNCRKPARPSRRGWCSACNAYLRRTGRARPVD